MSNSDFINKISYIIYPDGPIVFKILAEDLVMVSRVFSNPGDPMDLYNR